MASIDTLGSLFWIKNTGAICFEFFFFFLASGGEGEVNWALEIAE